MSVTYGTSVVTADQILCLDAGNSKSYSGSGTTWTDLSVSRQTATLAGSPTYTSGYFNFNGSTNTAPVPYTTLLDPTGGITIECWVYPTDITTNTVYTVFRKEGTGAVGRQNFAFAANGTQLKFGTDTTVNGYSEMAATISSGNYVNQWVQVVATYVPGSKVIYRNALSITSSAGITGALQQGNNGFCYYLGSTQAVGEFFLGRYSLCRMYNRALSSNEVLQNFNAQRGRYGI
jgi:hypothetical protein